MKIKYSLVSSLIITGLLSLTLNAQNAQRTLLATTQATAHHHVPGCGSPSTMPNWMSGSESTPVNTNAFEENDGQYINFVNNWKINYGATVQGVQVLFSHEGVLYYVPQSVKMTEEEIEKRYKGMKEAEKQEIDNPEEKESKYKTIYHKIAIQFEGANPNATIEAVGETPFYFGSINPTTPVGIDNIKGYRKIVYHDIYPGIDLEYTFSPDKGLKYAVKIHAGANPSLFKMHYTGQERLTLDDKGNLRISTAMGDIVDHAPVTKQGSATIASSFSKLDANNVVFKLQGANATEDINIDPWVIFPISPAYYPTDIGMDAANNVYVLEWSGGAMYMQKYNGGTGAVMWTYNMTQYGIQSSISDMTIDPAGNTYTPQPYYFFNTGGGSYSMLCLNAGGGLVYFYNTYSLSNVFETWNASYSCQYNDLIEAGSPTITQEQVGIVNPANGNFVGPLYINAGISELYTGNIAPNGYLYCISANHCFCTTGTSAFTNNLCCYNISGATAVQLWNVPIPKYNYADFSFKNPGGIPNNGITISCNEIYTTDGVTVYGLNVNTGAVNYTATIPGGVNTSSTCNSGIAVDPVCGYVYVGTQSNVTVYTSTLAPVTTYATPGIVYDVTYDDGYVAACGATTTGKGFVALFNAQTCPLPITMTHTNTTCGLNNGTATANPTFCTAPYTYKWSPGGQTTSSVSGLSAGTYTVAITTANSCITALTDTVTIKTSPPTFTITKATTASLCTGSTGTATVTVAGGSLPYTYLWSNGATTSNVTGLSSGSYCVTITDHGGCQDTVCMTVPNAGGLTVTINPFTNVSCFGGANGTADGNMTGGTPAYTYVWSNGATTSNVTGLSAGTYTLVGKDANGCTTNATVTITQPPQIRDSITAFKNPSCNNGTNGTATVGVKGGTGAYTYSWAPSGGTGATASNLSANTYTVTITDHNGCTNTATVTLANPTPVTATTTTTPSSCLGNTGSATATPSGGTGGTYSYSWAPSGGTAATAPNLSSGSYTVTVTDSNGCTGTASALVGNVGGEASNIVDVKGVKCYNQANGSAVDSATGGTLPYTYLWSNGQTTSTATGLSAGSYTVTTTDHGGCIATASIIITEPTQLRDSIPTNTPVACNGGSTGAATVDVKGGTTAYSYAWTPSGGTSVTASGLSAGTYTCTVTDANGCVVTASTTITQPPAIKLTAAAFPTSCFGGSDGQATVIPTGGVTPYTYAWSPSGGNAANANNLTAGTYTVTVTDAHGCIHDTSVVVTQPLAINVAFTADTLTGCYPLCFNFKDGSSDPNGGTITKWSWNFGDGSPLDTLQNPRHCYVAAGQYTVSLTVTTNKGCSGTLTQTNMITVWAHPSPDFTFGPQPTTIYEPTISFTDKSSDPYGIVSWSWNFNDPGNDIGSNLPNPTHAYSDTGIFCPVLTVTNVHGCVDSITHCLVISPQYTLFIPDAFSPNGDGKNDVFLPKGEYVYDYNMYIFDRWGLLLFHSTSLYQGWPGTYGGGDLCQEDTYVYLITCTDNLGQKHSYIGKVTLLK
jgi:gliding motility-associated-like protein